MPKPHLVRVGAQGQLGRYLAEDGTRYPRGARVIVRSGRGLEVAEVLSHDPTPRIIEESADGKGDSTTNGHAAAAWDGAIIRGMTVEDELLDARLRKHREKAVDACERLLAEHGHTTVLLDVEPLFDGRTLIFYFLGETSPELAELIDELAGTYESRAEIGRFAETLAHGCGPDCGTEAATGCGTSCGSCAVSGLCGTRK